MNDFRPEKSYLCHLICMSKLAQPRRRITLREQVFQTKIALRVIYRLSGPTLLSFFPSSVNYLWRAVNRQPGYRAANCRGARATTRTCKIYKKIAKLQTLRTSISSRGIHPHLNKYHPGVPGMGHRHSPMNSGRLRKFQEFMKISRIFRKISPT